MGQRIALVGSSGQARVVLDIIRGQGLYEPVGFIDSYKPAGEVVMGLPVLGSEHDLPALFARGAVESVFIAIGDNAIRSRLSDAIRALVPGLAFATCVHPNAAVAEDVVIGEGSVVMAGAVVNPNCRIGRHCIVNTRASLDHDSVMEDFASLAPGVTTGGGAFIGRFAALGIGSTLLHGRRVGEGAVVGAGSVVTRDIPEYVVAYGVPARVVRPREPGERYL